MVWGISFERNNVYDPNFFRIDYQWPNIPPRQWMRHTSGYNSQGKVAMGDRMGDHNVPKRWLVTDVATEYFARSNMGSKSWPKFQGANFAGASGHFQQRMQNSWQDTMAWGTEMMRPGGNIYRIDMELNREINLCLVTVRVFGHTAHFSYES
jgi:hypothetical protein